MTNETHKNNTNEKLSASKKILKRVNVLILIAVGLAGTTAQAASMGSYSLRTRYDAAIERAARIYRVDSNLIRAVISVESGFNQRAHSHAGAVGLMQLLPSTAHRFGARNPWNPTENIYAGTRYISYLMHMFNNNQHLVMAAYNAGEGTVIHGGYRLVSRGYVNKVMDFWGRFRNVYVAQNSSTYPFQ